MSAVTEANMGFEASEKRAKKGGVKTVREVRIETIRDTHFVLYVTRRKGQRYSAAVFYAADWTMEQVKAWVLKQPHSRLIEK